MDTKKDLQFFYRFSQTPMKWVRKETMEFGETNPYACFPAVEAALLAVDAPLSFTVSPEHVAFALARLEEGYLYFGPAPAVEIDENAVRNMMDYIGREAEDLSGLIRAFRMTPYRDVTRFQAMIDYLLYTIRGAEETEWVYAAYPRPEKNAAAWRMQKPASPEYDDVSGNRIVFSRTMMDAIRFGKVTELEKNFGEMHLIFAEDASEAISKEAMHDKFILALAKSSGAAVAGGLSPAVAEQLESHYLSILHKSRNDRDIVRLLKLMMIDFAARTSQTGILQTEDFLVQRALQDIERHLHEKNTPSIMADRLNVSVSHLCNTFKKNTGRTISWYVHERKMAEAKYLLAQPEAEITRTALALGYSSVNYFSTIFRKITGKTPTEVLSFSLER